MNKMLKVLLFTGMFMMFPWMVSAAAEDASVFASEEGQGMIKAPEGTEEEENLNKSGESKGVSWDAPNQGAAVREIEQGKLLVAIDPGHQGDWVDMSAQEPMAPGSEQTKAKATTGTQGKFTGVPEYEVNLEVSLALREELEARGYQVVMTREDNDTAISNKERAELATSAGADITVRIHANGDNDASLAGALTMAPTASNAYLSQEVIEKSNLLADRIIENYCAATGLENKGVISADNMTGTNWSTVPVAILEMGFMSNQGDDEYITDSKNHPAMVMGIADGIDEYFSIVQPEETEGEEMTELSEKLQSEQLASLEAAGEKWAVAVSDLSTKAHCMINAEQTMQSASVIKIFILGAVYENLVYTSSGETGVTEDEELKSLMTAMITVSDNEASNELVRRLGQGDFTTGAAVVDQFCQEHGYTATHLGRAFLAENPADDNYTSAADCCRILSDIYNGTLVNKEASDKMLELLKQQTRTGKIPAGVPGEVQTANKTGEMTAGYGLGVIENDIAIVLLEEHPYVICVLSNDIGDNGAAQSTITGISSTVYQYMSETQEP